MGSNKEERILEAALPLFAKFGIQKTTVDEIASAAQVGKGTIYLYFKSKQEIFVALARRETSGLFQLVRSAVRREKTATDQLRAFLRTRIQAVDDLIILYNLSREMLVESKADILFIDREFHDIERSIIEDIIEGGVESGEFQVADIPLVGLTISTALKALEEPWLFEGRELRPDKKVEILANLLINGLKNN